MNLDDLFGSFFWVILVATYLVHALPIYLIARKMDHEYAWLAWVPIGNAWLLCDLAGKEWWWIFGMGIPILCFIVFALIGMGLADAMDQPEILGLILAVPGLGLLLLYYLAFVPQRGTMRRY